MFDELEHELVGLRPIKTRIKEIAALLLVARVREQRGLVTERPTLHMSFTGRPGTGKTTVALRMARILHQLGYVRKGHLVVATWDDLVGQYVGHTAPKTKETIKRAMGGVLFIDEAYYLYRPENERDYGPEAIEMLLQVMENQREDLVVILAGYKERMETSAEIASGVPNSRRRLVEQMRSEVEPDARAGEGCSRQAPGLPDAPSASAAGDGGRHRFSLRHRRNRGGAEPGAGGRTGQGRTDRRRGGHRPSISAGPAHR